MAEYTPEDFAGLRSRIWTITIQEPAVKGRIETIPIDNKARSLQSNSGWDPGSKPVIEHPERQTKPLGIDNKPPTGKKEQSDRANATATSKQTLGDNSKATQEHKAEEKKKEEHNVPVGPSQSYRADFTEEEGSLIVGNVDRQPTLEPDKKEVVSPNQPREQRSEQRVKATPKQNIRANKASPTISYRNETNEMNATQIADNLINLIEKFEDDNRKKWAWAILFSPDRISFSKSHFSGVDDHALPKENILDSAQLLVFQDTRAARSDYGNAPGGDIDIDPELLKLIYLISRKYKINISEITGASHSKNSLHYEGLAVDINVIDDKHVSNADPKKNSEYRKFFQSLVGHNGKVYGPRDNEHIKEDKDHKDHYHIQLYR